MHLNFSWANQENKKQSTNIKRDEIDMINIINDNTLICIISFLNNDDRYKESCSKV